MDDKKQIIVPIITFLLGLLIGSILTLILIPSSCPSSEGTKSEEIEIKTDDKNVIGSSTEESNIEEQPIESESSVPLPISECNIYVDVAGAINKPGVYCFKDGSKIVDVIKKAEGFSKDVAYKYISMKINLSELITNHQKIYIPFKEDVYCEIKNLEYIDSEKTPPKQQEESNNTSDSTQTCININTASKEQLTSLNGIGESTAQKIIDARPFQKVDDILNVSGIGESTYEKFKSDICVY